MDLWHCNGAIDRMCGEAGMEDRKEVGMGFSGQFPHAPGVHSYRRPSCTARCLSDRHWRYLVHGASGDREFDSTN